MQRTYRGPTFGFHFAVIILLNLMLASFVVGDIVIYLTGAASINLFYFFYYRREMNYFALTANELIVRNPWRGGFQRTIKLSDIQSVKWFKAWDSGPYLVVTTREGKQHGFDGGNLGFDKMILLVDDLNEKIESRI
jgi:hypothetical protein